MISERVIVSKDNIGSNYFIAGLVLLEKGEGTLMAQVVTPLRTWEYLASKVVTLSLLSLAESLLIVGLTYGLNFDLLPLLAGIILVLLATAAFRPVALWQWGSLGISVGGSICSGIGPPLKSGK